jgi:hypothetical protein
MRSSSRHTDSPHLPNHIPGKISTNRRPAAAGAAKHQREVLTSALDPRTRRERRTLLGPRRQRLGSEYSIGPDPVLHSAAAPRIVLPVEPADGVLSARTERQGLSELSDFVRERGAEARDGAVSG